MKAAAMESLWQYLESLSLSDRNRKWLAGKLLETDVKDEDHVTKEEVIADIREGLKEVALYREGKLELKTLEEVLNEI